MSNNDRNLNQNKPDIMQFAYNIKQSLESQYFPNDFMYLSTFSNNSSIEIQNANLLNSNILIIGKFIKN